MVPVTPVEEPALGPAPGPEPGPVPGPAPGPELARLLAVGPFPAALRAAIEASGLSLERIRYRLGRRGAPISLSTLSCWQSGRRRPERAASFEALGRLEEVLDLPRGALAALLGPPRARGRRGHTGAPDLVEVYHDWDPIAEALKEFDTTSDQALVRLSQHERLRIGPDGGLRRLRSRSLVRAAADGPDRVIVIDQAQGNAPVIRPLRGCALGRVRADDAEGLAVAELLLDRPLRRGEAVVLEHEVEFSPPYPRDQDSIRRLRLPIREYVLDIEFTRPMLPARCVQFTVSAAPAPVETERVLALDPHDRACCVGVDLEPCDIGIRWEWPTP